MPTLTTPSVGPGVFSGAENGAAPGRGFASGGGIWGTQLGRRGRLTAFSAPADGAFVEGRRLLRHPIEEGGEARMGSERVGAGVVAGEFRLGQGRVDFAVANLVDQDRRAAGAALQFWRQVVV